MGEPLGVVGTRALSGGVCEPPGRPQRKASTTFGIGQEGVVWPLLFLADPQTILPGPGWGARCVDALRLPCGLFLTIRRLRAPAARKGERMSERNSR
jgi:hypothetical protein